MEIIDKESCLLLIDGNLKIYCDLKEFKQKPNN